MLRRRMAVCLFLTAVASIAFGILIVVGCLPARILSDIKNSMPQITVLIAALLFFVAFTSCIVARALVRNICADDTEPVYDELRPFTEKLREQREQIASQTRIIENERDKLSAIMKDMSEGLMILDMDKNILMANDSAQRCLRLYTEKPGMELEAVGEEFLQCINTAIGGESSETDVTIDGRYLQILANPVISSDEQVGVICLMLDFSDKLQVQKIKQEFTANVSHELKTPLTSISGYAEMIETGIARDEDIRGFAGTIHREAGRLITLISDVIKLSELDESSEEERFEDVSLRKLAEETAEILALAASKQNVTMRITGTDTVIRGNRHMLSELIYNLCDNAIRYNRQGGSVIVSLAENELSVCDTGIGIPEQHRERVFERFYRVDKSRSKSTGGTGLGLAIVKHVAELHSAKIRVESEVGSGTCITVTFQST